MASAALRQVSERGCRSTLKLTASYSAFANVYAPYVYWRHYGIGLPANDPPEEGGRSSPSEQVGVR